MSKAYGVIRRFSEDVDLTYDIRAIAADLVGAADAPLPPSKSQEKKWSREIRTRLSDWVGAEIVPRLKHDLEQNGLPATVRAEGDKVFIEYTPLATGTGYVAPAVMLENGRGKVQDLVIAPDYMAHGMRIRASELATEWLGPRTELDIRQGQLREVEQERLTSLGRMLLRQASADIVDLTQQPNDRQHQTVLRARLQRLEAMGLAGLIDANHWRLSPNMQQTLTTMSERGDILRTMHKALRGEQRELVLETALVMPILGRIAAKGLADELNDRGYLVVDGIDGRAHYVRLPVGADLVVLPMGGIVEVKPAGRERAVDRNIAGIAREGLYRSADHLVQLRQEGAADPQTALDAHVRRLEALRRSWVVERMIDGVWRIPPGFLSRTQAHDAQ